MSSMAKKRYVGFEGKLWATSNIIYVVCHTFCEIANTPYFLEKKIGNPYIFWPNVYKYIM